MPSDEQIAGEVVGVVEKPLEIFVGPLGRAVWQAPVIDRLVVAGPHVAISRTGVVDPDRIPRRSAQQLVQRLAGGLAAHVPKRDVDRRGGPHLGSAGATADVGAKLARVTLAVVGILAQQVGRDPAVDMRNHRIGVKEGLAQPDQTIVGMHPHEHQARKLGHLHGVDRGDLHSGGSSN